jgi:hypothetical protein
MNLSGSQKYNYQQIRKGVDNAIVDKEFRNKLYQSADGVLKVIDTIVRTKGEGWAVQVLNEQGKPMFTKEEQEQFTDAFENYIDPILAYFGEKREQKGGAEMIEEESNTVINNQKTPTSVNKNTNSVNNRNNSANKNNKRNKNAGNKGNKGSTVKASKPYIPTATELSGMSDDFIQTKIKQATQQDEEQEEQEEEEHPIGIDDLYAAFVNKIKGADQVVNEYASKYGILKLEKEHDLQPDVRLIPEPVALLISQGVTSVSAAMGYPVSPTVTLDALSKIKVSFRTIVFALYMMLDIARLSMAITGQETGRKILSVLVSVLELLRGDWKKAVLTFMGYYGMNPTLYGQMGKVFLTGFRMFSPDLQDQFIYGSVDASKSFVIGILLSIFQITAPEEVRLPLIAALEKIAKRQEEVTHVLQGKDLSARPDYLSPTFQDLNNIQAVMTDPAYVCSCEFEELVESVDRSAMIRTILQLLRMPVNKEFRKLKCGDEPCKPYVKEVVEESESGPSENQSISQNQVKESSTQDVITKGEVVANEVKENQKTPLQESIPEKEIKEQEVEVVNDPKKALLLKNRVNNTQKGGRKLKVQRNQH